MSARAETTVAFGEAQVVVRSDEPELIASVAATYRHLSGRGTVTAAVLTVNRRGDRFHTRKDDGPSARRASFRAALRWTRFSILETLIDARPDLLWMHGGVAATEAGAVLFPGLRGRGKSTIVTALCARGWRFLSDDIVPLEPATLRVHPFARVPEVRTDPGRQMPPSWLLRVRKTEIVVDDRVEREPQPLAAVVLPQARRTGGTHLVAVAPSVVAMDVVAGIWNFPQHGARAVEAISRLVATRPRARLTFHDGAAGAAAIDAWRARRFEPIAPD